jgi:hypothetical protein
MGSEYKLPRSVGLVAFPFPRTAPCIADVQNPDFLMIEAIVHLVWKARHDQLVHVHLVGTPP